MKLIDCITRKEIEISADSVIEIHSRGPYSEVKTGITIDDVVVASIFKVMEPVPKIIEMIRSEKTS